MQRLDLWMKTKPEKDKEIFTKVEDPVLVEVDRAL